MRNAFHQAFFYYLFIFTAAAECVMLQLSNISVKQLICKAEMSGEAPLDLTLISNRELQQQVRLSPDTSTSVAAQCSKNLSWGLYIIHIPVSLVKPSIQLKLQAAPSGILNQELIPCIYIMQHCGSVKMCQSWMVTIWYHEHLWKESSNQDTLETLLLATKVYLEWVLKIHDKKKIEYTQLLCNTCSDFSSLCDCHCDFPSRSLSQNWANPGATRMSLSPLFLFFPSLRTSLEIIPSYFRTAKLPGPYWKAGKGQCILAGVLF